MVKTIFVSVCVYVCMYVCVYVCMHTCMYACVLVYVCMYACKYVCMSECVCVCVYVCMHAYVYVCMHGPFYSVSLLTHYLNIETITSYLETDWWQGTLGNLIHSHVKNVYNNWGDIVVWGIGEKAYIPYSYTNSNILGI